MEKRAVWETIGVHPPITPVQRRGHIEGRLSLATQEDTSEQTWPFIANSSVVPRNQEESGSIWVMHTKRN